MQESFRGALQYIAIDLGIDLDSPVCPWYAHEHHTLVDDWVPSLLDLGWVQFEVYLGNHAAFDNYLNG